VQAAVQADIREVVLTGAQLSAYGRDLAPPLCLADLVRAILQDTNLPRLRLSSLEPWGISEGFFDLWSSSRLCRHLHLPLQSGCATTLRRMGRRTHPAHFAHLIASARAAIPGVAITTDLMVGFPGETDAEFAESLAFIEAQAFAGAHIFTFSARPGTPAALLPQPVPAKISRARSHLLRTSVEESANAFRRAFLGSVLTVLWETAAQTAGGWNLAGLSDNYLRVRATAPGDLKNRLLPVRIAGIQGHTLQGEMLPS
jgi:threonylcarbamoyladenosine tRNA methylthiotransferase MtaB